MVMTCRFSASTSMTSTVAPRACAREIRQRISAEPTPMPRRPSATTTPISVRWLPPCPVLSLAMAWPMITPFSVATSASVHPFPPVRMRSIAPLMGGAPEKNLR